VIQRPPQFGRFEFVVLSGLRAVQLIRGCTPRIESGHKLMMTAQMEVAQGKVTRAPDSIASVPVDLPVPVLDPAPAPSPA
jgi:DNA-directed RNA polymerase subunit K/omega